MLTAIITSYNYATLLARSIDCVLKQTVLPNEIIIIDDASTDNSIEIARKYMVVCDRIKLVVKDKNKGIIDSLNQGLALASCRYLAYVSADDIIFPGLFEKSLELLERYPSAPLSTGSVLIQNNMGSIQDSWSGPKHLPYGYIDRMKTLRLMRSYGFWIPGIATVYRRDALREHGGFPSAIGPMSDSFIGQVLALSRGFCFLPEPLGVVVPQAASFSQAIKADAQSTLRIRKSASTLMRTQYRSIFPESFVREWEAVTLFLDLVNVWLARLLKEQLRLLDKNIFDFQPRLGIVDKLFILLCKIMSYLNFACLLGYGVIKLWRYRLFWQYLSWSRIKTWVRKTMYRNECSS